MTISQEDIDKIDTLLKEEEIKNNALISELVMLREIIEKKEHEYLTMSDKERLNAKISKGFYK